MRQHRRQSFLLTALHLHNTHLHINGLISRVLAKISREIITVYLIARRKCERNIDMHRSHDRLEYMLSSSYRMFIFEFNTFIVSTLHTKKL